MWAEGAISTVPRIGGERLFSLGGVRWLSKRMRPTWPWLVDIHYTDLHGLTRGLAGELDDLPIRPILHTGTIAAWPFAQPRMWVFPVDVRLSTSTRLPSGGLDVMQKLAVGRFWLSFAAL